MKNGAKYEHLDLQALLDLLEKKYSQLALITNNKFNLELKCKELNLEVSELRKEIARKKQEEMQEEVAKKQTGQAQAQAKKQEKKQAEKGKEMTKPNQNKGKDNAK